MEKFEKTETKNVWHPSTYDEKIVYDVVIEGLAEGMSATDINTDYVEKKLCGADGVPGKVPQEKLVGLVANIHAKISEAENEAFLAALPIDIAGAVTAAVAAAEQELLIVLARQHAALQVLAEQKCEMLCADKRNAQYRISDLESELITERAALKKSKDELAFEFEECGIFEHELEKEKEARKKSEYERDSVLAELIELKEELRVAHSQIDRLKNETSSVDCLLAESPKPEIHDDILTVMQDIAAKSAAQTSPT